MRESIEFRIPAERADEYLPSDAGDDIGGVRRVIVEADTPLCAKIAEVHRSLRARGEYLSLGWVIRRHYSDEELAAATLFQMRPRKRFEPSGEECGTEYDDSLACAHCGAGSKQRTPLFLDGRRIPRNVDIAATIGGEIVVSSRFVSVFQSAGLAGVHFGDVQLINRANELTSAYRQLLVTGSCVALHGSTKLGEAPFEHGEYGVCPMGHVRGLNVLPEVSVQASTWSGLDLVRTGEWTGHRQGLLRPEPILLITPRFHRVITGSGHRGFTFEVAHLC